MTRVASGETSASGGASATAAVRRIEGDDPFSVLELEWDRHLERVSAPGAFLTHDWLRTWWERFGEGRLELYDLRRDGGLVGIVPLHRQLVRTRLGAVRVLRSLTNAHTPAYDFLLARGQEDVALRAWLRALRADRDWDALELDYVPRDSPALAALERACAGAGLAFRRIPRGVSPFVRIEGNWDQYYADRPKTLRDNLRYAERRLEQIGPCLLERVDESPHLDSLLDDAFEIEREGWKGERGTAILSSPAVTAFYRDLATRSARRGRFTLYFLRVGGRAVAFDYCVRYGRRLHLVKIGYRSDHLAKFSPGMVLRRRVLESLFRSREFESYEMLGIFADWKMKWTREVRPLDRLFAYSQGWRGAIRFWQEFGAPELAKRIPLVRALRRKGGAPGVEAGGRE